MTSPLPDSLPPMDGPDLPENPWSLVDLIVFAIFFGVTLAALPLVWRILHPAATPSSLTAVDQIVAQGVMDLMLVGFIAFLVKAIHGKSFRDTIHWYRNHQFSTGFLISLGATLAITVLIVSKYFPPRDTPLEKVLTTPSSIYLFALLGITLAPLSEEIIIRGFVFKVLSDVGGPGIAVVLSAAIFAALHIPQLWGSWAGIALIFLVGYVLSFIRRRSNSVIPSVIVHTSYNAMIFGLAAVGTFVQKGGIS